MSFLLKLSRVGFYCLQIRTWLQTAAPESHQPSWTTPDEKELLSFKSFYQSRQGYYWSLGGVISHPSPNHVTRGMRLYDCPSLGKLTLELMKDAWQGPCGWRRWHFPKEIAVRDKRSPFLENIPESFTSLLKLTNTRLQRIERRGLVC